MTADTSGDSNSSYGGASWAAIPFPSHLSLTGKTWTLGAHSRILVSEDDAPSLLHVAHQLLACLRSDHISAPPTVTIASPDKAQPGDIVLVFDQESRKRQHDNFADTAAPASLHDEHVILDVSDALFVIATSPTSALHGCSQIIQNLHAHGYVPRGRIESTPVVRERGFLLDIGRKRFTAQWIEHHLHKMAQLGLNSLQFHFSEYNGVGVIAPAMPELASPEALSPDELNHILGIARALNIDVIPSLDMPGHLEHILQLYPDLQLHDVEGKPVFGALDITNPKAVDFAAKILKAYIPLFPEAQKWEIGCDEFIDFDNISRYPNLKKEAERRFGEGATAFDLLTDFANQMAAILKEHGIIARVWNDGMFRSKKVHLSDDIEVMWWTNWSLDMTRLSEVINTERTVVNFDDQHLYYVLGKPEVYPHPSPSKLWNDHWHPGLFTPRGQMPQEVERPYPANLNGVCMSLWCDEPDDQTEEEIAHNILPLMRAFAERAWNGGSRLSLQEFDDICQLLS